MTDDFKIEKDIPCPSPDELKRGKGKSYETKYSFLKTIESGSSFECTWTQAQTINLYCKRIDRLMCQRWMDDKPFKEHTMTTRKNAKVRVWIYDYEDAPLWMRERLDKTRDIAEDYENKRVTPHRIPRKNKSK